MTKPIWTGATTVFDLLGRDVYGLGGGDSGGRMPDIDFPHRPLEPTVKPFPENVDFRINPVWIGVEFESSSTFGPYNLHVDGYYIDNDLWGLEGGVKW